MKSAYLTFSIFYNDLEYVVSGLYTPPDPGQTSGPPERCWPPEDHSFEIDEIHGEFSDPSAFTPEGIETLDNLALEKAAEIYFNQKDF